MGIFLFSGLKINKNGRRTLILIDFFTGFLLLFDALAYFYRGNTSMVGYHMVRLCNLLVFLCNFSASFFICFYICEFIKQSRLDFSLILNPKSSIKNGIPRQLFIALFFCLIGILLTVVSQFTNIFDYFDEKNIYHRSSLYPLSIVLGFLPGLITLSMLLQNRKKLAKNVFISLLVYFFLPTVGVVMILLVYGFSWINIALGLGSLHLSFSSIKLMELEFYSGERGSLILSPIYKADIVSTEKEKRLARNHFWQTLSVSTAGFILIIVIVSITGISLPEKTLTISQPYSVNTPSQSVCVTFVRNADKHWIDGTDLDRTGAQYDGVIFNNMKSTVITDWSFSISLPENCSVDPGPWNGTFSISDSKLNVRKPQEGDKENIHGYSLLKNCTHKIIRKTDIFTDTKNRQNTREIVYAACFI